MTCKMLCAGPGPQWTCNGLRLLFNLVLVKLYGNLTRTSPVSIWIRAHTPGEHSSMAMESQAGDHRLGTGGTGSDLAVFLHLESLPSTTIPCDDLVTVFWNFLHGLLGFPHTV